MKRENLIGKKFGKLKVIKKSKSLTYKGKNKKFYGTWECICDCGKTKIVTTSNLNRGTTKSCGCLRKEYRGKILAGQRFNRLITIHYKNHKWFCLCDCGNHTEVNGHSLLSNNTKSCGCLNEEVAKNKSFKLIEGRRQFPPHIASARRIWKAYTYRRDNCEITFDQFMKISQQNCYYCNIKPNTKYNCFTAISSRGSIKAKEEGLFIYNGIDRIDSNLNYTTNNICAACYNCNRAKNNLPINDFYKWIKKLSCKEFIPYKIKNKKLPTGSLKTSIKCAFRLYKKDTDLQIEQYYWLSQLNCFYCDTAPNNHYNQAKTDKKSSEKAKLNGEFIYNGIDRVNNAKGHTIDNIVPCCKYCNFAKSKLTLEEFYTWIKRIKNYQATKTYDEKRDELVSKGINEHKSEMPG